MYLVSVYQTNRTFVWSFSIGSKLNLVLILSGDMESMLGDVEISLLALEDTIDAREMQEKQLEQRFQLGTIHLRRQHVLEEEGCPHVPMVQRSQYLRIKNLLHKHFAGMPLVGG